MVVFDAGDDEPIVLVYFLDLKNQAKLLVQSHRILVLTLFLELLEVQRLKRMLPNRPRDKCNTTELKIT